MPYSLYYFFQRSYYPLGAGEAAANADRWDVQDQRYEQEGSGQQNIQRKPTGFERGTLQDHWANWPTQSPICTGDDGISLGLEGITFPKWRTESIKAGDNAIVPQVAYQLFRAIELTNQAYPVKH